MIQTQKIDYHDGDTLLEGYCAFDNAPAKKPIVLVAHDWSGRNDFACKKAEKLAEMGYIGFALDLYGKGIVATDNDQKKSLMSPLIEDRSKLLSRMLAGFQAARELPNGDRTKMAAIGYCFGGLCVLDLARSGAELQGVVSFHGALTKPDLPTQTLKAKVLVLHGFNDPMVPLEQVAAFEQEMNMIKADWQMNIYGNTMHAFTNPTANDANFGTVYNASADKRSWIAMQDFFKEIF